MTDEKIAVNTGTSFVFLSGRPLPLFFGYGIYPGISGFLACIEAMGAHFPESLSNAVPSVTKKEAGQIQRAALQESFGNEELSGMQGRDARRVYKKVCSAIYERLPWYKKIYFRYGKVYR